jgi:hypothetical protein
MFSPTPSRRPAERTWRAAVRRAVDLAVAFATLEDSIEPRGHDDDRVTHPHRRPLRAVSRARRPGAGAARPQHCVTPTTRAAGDTPAKPRRHVARTPSVR